MSHKPIPERVPVGDAVDGALIKIDDSYLLVSPADHVTEGVDRLASGTFVVRYGLVYLGKPQYAIVPGLVALDYGEILVGDEAWNFILKRSNLYPRAEVIGYRSDGFDDMITVKWLDLAQAVRVFLFRDAAAVVPLAEISAVIAAPEVLPPRLLSYLPHFESIAIWHESDAARGEST